MLGKHVCGVGQVDIVLPDDPFVALVRSVVGQQLSGRPARAIYERLVMTVGMAGITPGSLLRMEEDELRSVGLSAAQVRTLRSLATAAKDGLDFRDMRRRDDEHVIEALTRLPGIGRWTAEMVLIFALGRPDVMSAPTWVSARHWRWCTPCKGYPSPRRVSLCSRVGGPIEARRVGTCGGSSERSGGTV